MKQVAQCLFSLLIISALACSSTDEGTGCREWTCEDGFTLTYVGPLNAGSYSLRVVADTSEVLCDFTVADDGSADVESCEGNYTVLPSAETLAIHAPGTAITVALTEKDTMTSAVENFSPRYSQHRPNGEGCPPVCLTDEDVMDPNWL